MDTKIESLLGKLGRWVESESVDKEDRVPKHETNGQPKNEHEDSEIKVK